MNSGTRQLPQARLHEEVALLAAYLLSSGRGLLDEPADYGVFRCTDGARRALELLEQIGGGTPELTDVRQRLDTVMFTPMGSDLDLKTILDNLCGDMASALKK
jgi:hypothetical protein